MHAGFGRSAKHCVKKVSERRKSKCILLTNSNNLESFLQHLLVQIRPALVLGSLSTARIFACLEDTIESQRNLEEDGQSSGGLIC
jgi:hypothetical protein